MNTNIKRATKQIATSPLIEYLTRLGYVVRGLVYGVIGALALEMALGKNANPADQAGAISALSNTPLGEFLLYIILAGLLGYAVWGLIRAVLDPLHKGIRPKGIIERVGYAVSGISYLVLAVSTYNLLAGTQSTQSSGEQTKETTASILSKSWGVWLIGVAAMAVIGAGIVQIARGLSRDFEKQFQPYALNRSQRKWINRLGRFGTIARGIVFGLVGLFLLLAAYNHDPNQAQSIDGVFTDMLGQPYGPWLVGIVAFGLVAFGIYSAVSGLWLRLKR
jgi:hypothetical protein